MNSVRWWLSLVYVAASLLALGVHDHDRESAHSTLESRGDCDDPRPHVAGHEQAAHGDAPSVCPSCQYRSQHSLLAIIFRPQAGPSVPLPPSTSRPANLPGAPLRTRCRAPPFA